MPDNKFQRFNHSYMHCRGVKCPMKDDCASHLAYLEAVDLKILDIQIMNKCESPSLNYVKVIVEKSKKK